MMKFRFLVPLTLLFLSSCGERKDFVLIDGVSETVCKLGENLGVINVPSGFDMVNDTSFVLCDMERVFLYNLQGTQIREIGHVGNARYEYNFPQYVMAEEDTIYVWSANSLKFICFAIDGTPESEYRYESAIRGFLPTKDKIYISACGRREEYLVDVLDKKTSIPQGYGEPSDAHNLLAHYSLNSPLGIINGKVLFASKDKLDVYRLTDDSLSSQPECQFLSSTFKVEEVDDFETMESSYRLWGPYIRRNPLTLMVLPDESGNPALLTMEGVSKEDENGKESDEGRYYGYYTIDRGGKTRAKYYSHKTFGGWPTLSNVGNTVYFIVSEIVDDDISYYLKKIVL